MARASESAGRTIVAVISSYLGLAITVWITEQLLSSLSRSYGGTFPLYYFVIDLTSQCFYTVAAGYLCRAIARSSQSIALAGLISIGLLVGTLSLVMSWGREPHWYGVGLLVSYAPCVLIGWGMRSRRNAKPRQDL